MTPSAPSEPESWPPHPHDIQSRIWDEDDPHRSTTILIRHPATPFVRQVRRGDERALRKTAYDYLVEINRAVGNYVPEWWFDPLNPDTPEHPDFGWLPLEEQPAEGKPRPVASFFVESGREPDRLNRTLILLATDHAYGHALASEFGLRVVAHLRSGDGELDEVRITGLSASLHFGEYEHEGDTSTFWAGREGNDIFHPESLEHFRAFLGPKLGLEPGSISFRGVRLGRQGDEARRIEVRGRGVSVSRVGHRHLYEFIAVARVGADLRTIEILSSSKVPLVACMAGEARVFRQDPASLGGSRGYRRRRPSRAEEALDAYRTPEPQPDPLELADRLRVLQTQYVLGDTLDDIKRVPLQSPPPVRSNDFAAVSTFRNLRQLFDRFELYGISPESYFRLARLPLKAYYRSGIRPGPGKDGQTVNARVLPEGWDVLEVAAPEKSERPNLRVHLALGDLTTRARRPRNGAARVPAEPLGLAADPRWVWHEIGHILLMAALGELEFRFAHSPGDALAAIVADPFSELAAEPGWRGHTFPWVFIPRRHDRCVLHGWGWSGSLGSALRQLPEHERLRRKGYWSEQILSTSLFRLYRCLGGDTVIAGTDEPDRAARKRASDYTVYLVIAALRMLGDQRIVPANKAEMFAAALSDADEGTEACPTDDGEGNIAWRTGGCAHKVIRWAFEAQGMYSDEPDAIRNAPGRPPRVDIYIPDLRSDTEDLPNATVRHGPGSYVPVSLDWGGLVDDPPLDEIPQWFARDEAIRPTDDGIEVTVANRGAEAAQDVTVTLWWCEWPAGEPPPLWNEPGWTQAGTSAAKPVEPGTSEVFGPFAFPTQSGRCLVLAQASCAADRANTEPATGLSCSRNPTPLAELVASDNNLGLALVPASKRAPKRRNRKTP